jgi:hypothetical protein
MTDKDLTAEENLFISSPQRHKDTKGQKEAAITGTRGPLSDQVVVISIEP